MKKLLSLLLLAAFALTLLPSGIAGAEAPAERGMHSSVVIDSDPQGGYTGDYVVIYNPSSSTLYSASTGSLAGLIETSVDGAKSVPAKAVLASDPDLPYVIDVDAAMQVEGAGKPVPSPKRETFTVGMTRAFTISSYNPAGAGDLTFKLLYQGAHCNIWTVTNEAYYPLDKIDPTFAQTAANEFDSKFDLMTVSYGDFNDTNGDGRVNLMYYNIDDGWELGQGYVAGYFSNGDYTSYNYLPMIHIDTYPGVTYVNAAGETKVHFSDTFGTIVHEFQHCINYCETGGMNVWLNEALSGSAEELCYPGLGLLTRIQDWTDHRFASADELAYPPAEYKYNSFYNLHKGGSITAWDQYDDDIYARYGLVMLFTQYLYSRWGDSTVFKRIIDANPGSTVADSYDALTNGTGWSLESIFRGFFTSLAANCYESGYGFKMNEGYDPSSHYGIENMYSLLSPVIYTSTSAASIYSGGFITVKPVNGVFNPPSGAGSALKYVGISFGSVGLEGISLYPAETETLMHQSVPLTLRLTPFDANDYEITWTSSDPAVATVEGGKTAAVVTTNAFGSAVITARATDNSTGSVYTATSVIRVKNGYSYTRYEPTATVEEGVPYLIGFNDGANVYVMMNYNPNPANVYAPRYYKYDGSQYAYGVRAITDGEGNVTGIDASVYPDAAVAHAEWVFEPYSSSYYKIQSGYEAGYYLCIYAMSSSYVDLYASSTGPTTGWQWSASSNSLSYYVDTRLTKYVTYNAAIGEKQNLFSAEKAPSDNSAVTLYKKTSGIVIYDDDPTYYTVTFVDHDGTVLSVQQVEEGRAAAAPASPSRTGYTFTGWDKDFSNVTSDMTVTAQYSINSYTLTINYVDEDGGKLCAAYSGTFEYGVAYSVASPEIEGYTPDQANVAGTMGAENVTVTVTYTKDEVGPEILLGDANCDGIVDFSDAAAIAAYVMTGTGLSAQGILNADVNQTGGVNAADITALYNMLFA